MKQLSTYKKMKERMKMNPRIVMTTVRTLTDMTKREMAINVISVTILIIVIITVFINHGLNVS